MITGRKNILGHLEASLSNTKEHSAIYWVHCASLGEFEQGRPVMEAIKKEDPKAKIVLTFFSPSGYEVRKNYEEATVVTYLPWDGAKNARAFIEMVEPDVVFFIKYEFWFYYLRELNRCSIPVFSVSTLLMPDFLPFRWYGVFYRKMLQLIGHYFVQDQQTMQLLQSIGIQNVSVAGDTRFDRVMSVASKAKPLPEIETFKGQNRIMVIGSSWPEDIKVLRPFIDHHLREWKFIIAPHNIYDHELGEMEDYWQQAIARYSELNKLSREQLGNKRILLIDNMGMLTSLYSYGSIAYVGGAFGRGLHNILEPAVFGMPVFFGSKNYKKFREAVLLLEAGGAFTVSNTLELENQCGALIQNDSSREGAGKVARNFVVRNAGATDIIINYLKEKGFFVNGK